MRHAKTIAFLLAGSCICLGAMSSIARSQGKPNPKLVKRGQYLVNAIGCGDCHTPLKMGPKGDEPDMARMLSGHPQSVSLTTPPAPGGPWIGAFNETGTAFAGPWGISYTRNLTPDKETGLGDWTEQNFIETIRTGKRMGKGRELLPPMPYESFRNMTDEDLKSIFAYLRTIPVVKNKVSEPIPPAGQPGSSK